VLVSNYQGATVSASRAKFSGGSLSGTAFRMRIQFTFDDPPPASTTAGRSAREGIIIQQRQTGTIRNFVNFSGFHSGAFLDPFLTALNISSTVPPSSTTPPATVDFIWQIAGDLVYIMEWDFDLTAGVNRARVWRPQLESPPFWQVSGVPRTGTPDQFEVFQTSVGPVSGTVVGNSTLRVQSIDIFDCPDGPAQGVLINGHVCEEITSAGSTIIVLQQAFLAGSIELWIKGLLQRPEEYTEYPTAGSIELDFAPNSGDSIRVCYWSLP